MVGMLSSPQIMGGGGVFFQKHLMGGGGGGGWIYKVTWLTNLSDCVFIVNKRVYIWLQFR